MHKRSFGLIVLPLAVVAIAPGVLIVTGLLLMIPALQMIVGRPAPIFHRRIAVRPLPTRRLAALVQRLVAVLIIAMVVTPVPFTNVVPALVIVLISLAYLDEDGLLLSIVLLAGGIVPAVELVAVWETILGAKWIVGLLVLARHDVSTFAAWVPSRLPDSCEVSCSKLNRNCDRPHPIFRSTERNVGFRT